MRKITQTIANAALPVVPVPLAYRGYIRQLSITQTAGTTSGFTFELFDAAVGNSAAATDEPNRVMPKITVANSVASGAVFDVTYPYWLSQNTLPPQLYARILGAASGATFTLSMIVENVVE